jgi:dTDP-4-dehydrorhamnose reductase
MPKVLIIGTNGLLGNRVFWEFLNDRRFTVSGTTRAPMDEVYGRQHRSQIYFDCIKSNVRDLPPADYVINCVGVLKPNVTKNIYETIYVNAAFPHLLSEWAETHRSKLIHITSDCVYTGAKGQYTEEDQSDMNDYYGKTKSLGEPDNCMVLRTSIIGPEEHSHISLVDWVRGHRSNDTIQGYTDHFWNGVTTRQYSDICKQIILDDLYKKELYHVFSPTAVSKHELVTMINNHYDLNITITPTETGDNIDRTLSTVKDLNSKLNIPELKSQVDLL